MLKVNKKYYPLTTYIKKLALNVRVKISWIFNISLAQIGKKPNFVMV